MIRCEHDCAVVAPASAAVIGSIAERDRRAALHGNLLQLAVSEEADPLAIGRKEGIAGILRAGKRGGLQLVERADVDAPLLVGTGGNKSQPRAVG